MTRKSLNTNARRLALSLVSGLLLFGCDDSVDTPPADGSGDGSGQATGSGDGSGSVDETSIAIVGDYDTNFGGFFRVTDTSLDNDWYAPSSHTVLDWSNAEGWILAQNDASAGFNPSLYSRFDFIVAEEGVYYCQTVYDAADEETALAAERADETDPATSGCGGAFAWTLLTPGQGPMSLTGQWVDSFGQSQSFVDGIWTLDTGEFGIFTGTIESYSNAEEYFISLNAEDNGDTAGLYSRVDWTWSDGAFFYCQTAFDAADAAAAEAVERADDSDPANAGCGDFAWSELSIPAQ